MGERSNSHSIKYFSRAHRFRRAAAPTNLNLHSDHPVSTSITPRQASQRHSHRNVTRQVRSASSSPRRRRSSSTKNLRTARLAPQSTYKVNPNSPKMLTPTVRSPRSRKFRSGKAVADFNKEHAAVLVKKPSTERMKRRP
jgi:hypothetical protein